MSFFKEYDIYAKDNYAPDNFHRWCSYAALAACTSRQTWLEVGRFRFFANLYIVLVGGAGCGKTTSMDLALRIIRQVGRTTISPNRQSKEDFITQLARASCEYITPDGLTGLQTPFLIYAPELAQWLSIDAIGMTDLWTSLYDERDDFVCSTLRHGKQVVREPYINILAGVQPDKFARYISADIMSTGLLRRTIFASPIGEKPKKLVLEISPESVEAEKRCVQIATDISNITGPMTLSKEAREWFIDWFEKRQPSKHPLLAQFEENMHVQLLKLSMLQALGQRLDKVISLQDLQLALFHLEQLKQTLPDTLAGIARNSLKTVSDILLSIIESYGGCIEQKELRVHMWPHCNSAEFSEILAYLAAVGKIVVLVDARTRQTFIQRTHDVVSELRPIHPKELTEGGDKKPPPNRTVPQGPRGQIWR